MDYETRRRILRARYWVARRKYEHTAHEHGHTAFPYVRPSLFERELDPPRTELPVELISKPYEYRNENIVEDAFPRVREGHYGHPDTDLAYGSMDPRVEGSAELDYYHWYETLLKAPYYAIKYAYNYGKTYWLYTALGLLYLYGHDINLIS